MEPRFGHDFSKVRVHTDAKAAESASAMNAQAYTVGRDMVFGSRRYMPGTTTGDLLIAHELTHVVQQGRSRFHCSLSISLPGDALSVKPMPQQNRQSLAIQSPASKQCLHCSAGAELFGRKFSAGPTKAAAWHGGRKRPLAVAEELSHRRCVVWFI
jgi:hypothetical protein